MVPKLSPVVAQGFAILFFEIRSRHRKRLTGMLAQYRGRGLLRDIVRNGRDQLAHSQQSAYDDVACWS